MLKSSGSEGRGVIAKVADFGLAVKIDAGEQTHMSNMFQVCEGAEWGLIIYLFVNWDPTLTHFIAVPYLSHTFIRAPSPICPPSCCCMAA